MDEPTTDETDFPRTCPHCGTPLETATVGHNLPTEEQRSDHAVADIVAQDFCPNPDCPGSSAPAG